MPQEQVRDMKQGGVPYLVTIEIEEIPVDAEPDFDNLFGREFIAEDQRSAGVEVPIGSAKVLALRWGVKSIRVGNDIMDIDKWGPVRCFREQGYGQLRNPETYESIVDRMVRLVVKHSPILSEVQPYSGVFRRFTRPAIRRGAPDTIPAEAAAPPAPDPTRPAGTPGSGSQPSSDGGAIRPQKNEPDSEVYVVQGPTSTDAQ